MTLSTITDVLTTQTQRNTTPYCYPSTCICHPCPTQTRHMHRSNKSDKQVDLHLSHTLVMVGVEPNASPKAFNPTSVILSSTMFLCVSSQHGCRSPISIKHTNISINEYRGLLVSTSVKQVDVLIIDTLVMVELERNASPKAVNPASVTFIRPVLMYQ